MVIGVCIYECVCVVYRRKILYELLKGTNTIPLAIVVFPR